MGEANLEIVSSPIVLIGDIHGQFYDVLKLLSIGTPFLSKLDSHPIQDTSSSGISWIEDTTPCKPYSYSFAWSFSILRMYTYSGAIINPGNSIKEVDKFRALTAFTNKSTASMVAPMSGKCSIRPLIIYRWLHLLIVYSYPIKIIFCVYMEDSHQIFMPWTRLDRSIVSRRSQLRDRLVI